MSNSPDPATWASTVSRRHYSARRDELDALIIAMVPSYQSTVTAELERFESGASSAISQYDAEHAGPAYARPPHPRLAVVLFWVYFFATAVAFGIMLPIGGRSVGASRFPDSSWQYLIVVSFALFAVAVLTQLIRAFPLRPGVPPRKDLAWLPAVLGIPALVVMYLRVRQDIGVDPLWANLTAAVLSVSVLYCIIRWVRRARHPELTRVVDSADDVRVRTLRARVLELGNRHAERIIEHFDALPRDERDTLRDAFDSSADILRNRGLVGRGQPRDRRRITKVSVGRLTPVPGFLLLATAISRAWNPDPMIYTRRRRISWFVSGWERQPRFGGPVSKTTAPDRSPR
ncbi:MAG: hypothetical protein ACOH10_05965 [Rhodoglobus sp.]|uniref:hypothetical protein n=1 Tax=Salinibacterium sp. G-O1 TaxID=3046208 RepID=UPI0024B8927F|nr:hypothetical protein [Salinibacterium sp. G-O1]MDJ0335772.1 hypothetical protein [Salinibacterium sp. G-O1]